MSAANSIPYAYIRGAEMNLINEEDPTVLQGDDGVHQLLTSLRRMVSENPLDSLNIIDKVAAKYGVMPADAVVALTVAQTCGYATTLLLPA